MKQPASENRRKTRDGCQNCTRKSPPRDGVEGLTLSEAPDHAATDKEVVLAAFVSVEVEVGSSRPKISHLTAHTERMGNPYVQAQTHLKDSGVRAFPGIGAAEFQVVGHSKMSITASDADPRGNTARSKRVGAE